jgi:hypothetical protein
MQSDRFSADDSTLLRRENLRNFDRRDNLLEIKLDFFGEEIWVSSFRVS